MSTQSNAESFPQSSKVDLEEGISTGSSLERMKKDHSVNFPILGHDPQSPFQPLRQEKPLSADSNQQQQQRKSRSDEQSSSTSSEDESSPRGDKAALSEFPPSLSKGAVIFDSVSGKPDFSKTLLAHKNEFREWTLAERTQFEKSLLTHSDDFLKISEELKQLTPPCDVTINQCVDFFYTTLYHTKAFANWKWYDEPVAPNKLPFFRPSTNVSTNTQPGSGVATTSTTATTTLTDVLEHLTEEELPWNAKENEFVPKLNKMDVLAMTQNLMKQDQIQERSRHCLCQGPVDGSQMLSCSECKNWFHSTCVGLNRDMIGPDSVFRCFKCARFQLGPELEKPLVWKLQSESGEAKKVYIVPTTSTLLASKVEATTTDDDVVEKATCLMNEPVWVKEVPENTREYVLLTKERNVPVWDFKAKRLLAGSQAPTVGQLEEFLQSHPDSRPYLGEVTRNPFLPVLGSSSKEEVVMPKHVKRRKVQQGSSSSSLSTGGGDNNNNNSDDDDDDDEEDDEDHETTHTSSTAAPPATVVTGVPAIAPPVPQEQPLAPPVPQEQPLALPSAAPPPSLVSPRMMPNNIPNTQAFFEIFQTIQVQTQEADSYLTALAQQQTSYFNQCHREVLGELQNRFFMCENLAHQLGPEHPETLNQIRDFQEFERIQNIRLQMLQQQNQANEQEAMQQLSNQLHALYQQLLSSHPEAHRLLMTIQSVHHTQQQQQQMHHQEMQQQQQQQQHQQQQQEQFRLQQLQAYQFQQNQQQQMMQQYQRQYQQQPLPMFAPNNNPGMGGGGPQPPPPVSAATAGLFSSQQQQHALYQAQMVQQQQKQFVQQHLTSRAAADSSSAAASRGGVLPKPPPSLVPNKPPPPPSYAAAATASSSSLPREENKSGLLDLVNCALEDDHVAAQPQPQPSLSAPSSSASVGLFPSTLNLNPLPTMLPQPQQPIKAAAAAVSGLPMKPVGVVSLPPPATTSTMATASSLNQQTPVSPARAMPASAIAHAVAEAAAVASTNSNAKPNNNNEAVANNNQEVYSQYIQALEALMYQQQVLESTFEAHSSALQDPGLLVELETAYKEQTRELSLHAFRLHCHYWGLFGHPEEQVMQMLQRQQQEQQQMQGGASAGATANMMMMMSATTGIPPMLPGRAAVAAAQLPPPPSGENVPPPSTRELE